MEELKRILILPKPFEKTSSLLYHQFKMDKSSTIQEDTWLQTNFE